jgi:hypothetical protein
MLGSRRRSNRGSGSWWPFGRRTATLPDEHWAAAPDHADRPPRVLVECEDAGMIWAVERLLGDAGYDVAGCVGPSVDATCALTATGHCELQAGADVIINHFGTAGGAEDVAALVHATRMANPGTPVIVSARALVDAEDLASEDTVVLAEPWLSPVLVASVDEAAHRSRPGEAASPIT